MAKDISPVLHQNGSGKKNLTDLWLPIYHQADVLLTAMAKATPNGRDYRDWAHHEDAMEHHRAMARKVHEVRDYAEQMLEHISK